MPGGITGGFSPYLAASNSNPVSQSFRDGVRDADVTFWSISLLVPVTLSTSLSSTSIDSMTRWPSAGWISLARATAYYRTSTTKIGGFLSYGSYGRGAMIKNPPSRFHRLSPEAQNVLLVGRGDALAPW